MSEDETAKPKPPPVPGMLDDSIVAEARASISNMLGTAIGALGKDLEKTLSTNAAAQTEVQKAVTQITSDLIKLLADRVQGLLSEAAAPSAPKAGAAPGAEPPKAAAPQDENQAPQQ